MWLGRFLCGYKTDDWVTLFTKNTSYKEKGSHVECVIMGLSAMVS